MTEDMKTPEELEAELALFTNDLVEQNKFANEKREVSFVGGGANGSKFTIPNGVSELYAETPYGDEQYIRNPQNELEFIPKPE